MSDNLSNDPDLVALLDMVPRVEPVTIAGRVFYVRGMTGAERADFRKRQIAATRGDRPPLSDADIVALTLVDQAGKRKIPNGDATILGGVDGGVLDKLARAALAASMLLEESPEEAEKN